MINEDNNRTGLEIAIIGMSGRFPGAQNTDQFWANLKNGVESISVFTEAEMVNAGTPMDLLKRDNYIKAKGIIEDVDYFDSSFFGFTPNEAELLDPQIRLFFECVWEALENAGYNPVSYPKLIGLYAGATDNITWQAKVHLVDNSNVDMISRSLLCDKDLLSALIAYKLNLKGPVLSLQTNCSTSLVAIHLACQALLNGECNIALAGGISINFPQISGYRYEEGMIFSPDGHCRTFDAKSNGTVFSNGAGVVALKLLEDAIDDGDNIYAIIKGSAINNDGNRKIGFTAPSIKGQSEAIRDALKAAEVDPESITYLEAHGTGTPIGDPIEIEALKIAYNSDQKQYCRIGSVKTNIGHLDVAAGVAGFIKTVLAIKNRFIPPSLHYQAPNPKIDFTNSPFVVNTQLMPWRRNGGPLRAGVSAFGVGGTNAHVILEEAPEKESRDLGRAWQLLLLSAKTPTSLQKMSDNLVDYFGKNPDINLADLAYTLQVGRAQFSYRKAIVASNIQDAIEQLSNSSEPENELDCKTVVFMFPGQGSQYINMGRGLYFNEQSFRDEVDRCLSMIKSMLPYDIKSILYPESDQTNEIQITGTEVAQPLIFIFEYALAQVLMKWGIKPDFMIGHSLGEYVAACLSGVFSLEDALSLVILRGKLIKELPAGTMLSVLLSEAELAPFLTGGISLAAVNGSSSCVLSGSHQTIERVANQLSEIGCQCIKLPTSHAFHSPMMEPVLGLLVAKMKQIKLNKPKIPYLSNLTGQLVTAQDAMSPEYWAKHLRNTVRFANGLGEILNNDGHVFIEVGPGRTLSGFVKQHRNYKGQPVVNLIRHSKEAVADQQFLLKQLGKLWFVGLKIDWERFYQFEKRYRIPLPTYPFERQRYGSNGNPFTVIQEQLQSNFFTAMTKTGIENWFYLPSWKRSDLCGKRTQSKTQRCLVFVSDHHLAVQILSKLRDEFQELIVVQAGAVDARPANNVASVNPGDKNSYGLLLDYLYEQDKFPEVIIHLWNITDAASPIVDVKSVRSNLDKGFYSLLYLAWAIKKYYLNQTTEIIILSSNLHEVTGDESIDPGKAMLLGPCKVIPQEFPNIRCRCIDIIPPESGTKQEEVLLTSLMKEFSIKTTEPVVAYRNNHRWIQLYEPLRVELEEQTIAKKEFESLNLRKQGVYLITGGLGKIGLILAKYLAETVRAKIILIGHSEFPAGEEWEQWLSNHAPDNPISQKIIKIKEIQTLTTGILIYQANLSNTSEMNRIINSAEGKLGKINGVVHAAGVTRTDLISEIDRETSENHFLAKVYGLIGLAEVLKDHELDFCILMSSLSSVLGGLGLVAYSAANIFMDGFAQKVNKNGKSLWISVNWDGWNVSEDKTIDPSIHSKLMNLAISPSEGWDVFQRILTLATGQIIVSTSSLEMRLKKWIRFEIDDRSSGQNKETQHSRPNLMSAYVAPSDEVEMRLAGIWQEILGFSKIGVDDNYFELGGDSLKVTVLISRINQAFNVELSLREIFNRSTIKEIAGLVKECKQKQYLTIQKVEPREYYAVSAAQRRMYILDQLEPDSVNYNISSATIIEGALNQDRLTSVFRKLVRRHEAFRTSFELIQGEPMQLISEAVEMEIDYRRADETQLSEIINQFIRPFDLKKAPLLRVELVAIDTEKHILLVDMHHIISDGVSMSILIRDFSELYAGKELPELRIQYKDFSEWQNQFFETSFAKQQEEYWTHQFQDGIPVLNLPTDFPRPEVQSFKGDRITFSAKPELVNGLQKITRETGTTMFMVLLAGFIVLLSRYTGQEDLVVGTPIAGRLHADLADIVGMFANTLVIRTQPIGIKTFGEYLSEVKENALKAYENQEYQFDELVKHMKVTRDPGRNPLFDIIFVMQNFTPNEFHPMEQGIRFTPYDQDLNRIKFELQIRAIAENNGLRFSFEYNSKLFKPETIQRMMIDFITILEQVTRNTGLRLTDIELGNLKHSGTQKSQAADGVEGFTAEFDLSFNVES